MKVSEVYAGLQKELKRRNYFVDMEVLEQTTSLIKARLVISSGLFVQIYRNDRFKTTNLALIYNGNRLFARGEVDGRWHRHLYTSLGEHDFSAGGQRASGLAEFLDEVETVLAELDLP